MRYVAHAEVVLFLCSAAAAGCAADQAAPGGSEVVVADTVDVAGDSSEASDSVAADTLGAADTLDTSPEEIREPIGCGSGAWPLAEGLLELAFDDGAGVTDLTAQDWAITVEGVDYRLADGPIWEATRFELHHPSRIHGFAIQWSNLPADPEAELVAGLYRDFGYNGFDFWRAEPLWEGTRCLGDAAPGEWLSYVFDAPIDLDHPGLVFVGHRRADADSPAFAFDGSAVESCEAFDACPSSLNLPQAGTDIGTTFPFGRDFMLRLYVEHVDDRAPEERLFQPLADLRLGSRVAWGDYDADGWDDLLTNGPKLYRNDGEGGFVDVTEAAALVDAGLAGSGGVWGDWDNDGCLDLFLFAESLTRGDTLLRSNCDGTFSDVTEAAGIDDTQTYDACDQGEAGTHSPTAAAAWVDLDGDGLLDLYAANMMCWTTYTYYSDLVYRNRGDGTFEDATAELGFLSRRTASRGVSPADYDGDGDVDLLVNNYVLQPNLFYENLGDGSVSERSVLAGLAGHFDTESGVPRYGHTIGTAWGDLDNDGDLDLIEANLAHPRFHTFSDKTRVLLNDGVGHFSDRNTDWSGPRSDGGLRYQETHSVPVLADFDADGALDLFITAVYDGRPTDFYWGQGDGTFALDAYRAGITTENGWGAAASDYDNDGDVDLVAYSVFENTGVEAPGQWLSVAVVGDVAANRAGLGATVRVEAGAQSWLRHVQGGSGQGCQDSRYLHFGLGEVTEVDRIVVTFPGGSAATFEGPHQAGQRLWLSEAGAVHAGWAPPLH